MDRERYRCQGKAHHGGNDERRKTPKFISDEGFVSNEVRENMEKLLRTGEYLNLNNDKITRDFDFLKSALYFDAGNYWFEDNQTNIGIVTFQRHQVQYRLAAAHQRHC